MRFEGKTAVVTGAGGGVGEEGFENAIDETGAGVNVAPGAPA